jgi:hypothetical protein
MSWRNALSLPGLVLGLGLAFAPACASSEPAPEWVSGEVTAQDDRLLLDVTALALQKSGFPIGTGVSPDALTIVSGWQNSLQPFRGKGWRAQCVVQYQKEAPRKYKIDVRVKKEKNDDILQPLNLSYAKWIPDPDDGDRARTVLQHIRSLLDTDIEVGEKR